MLMTPDLAQKIAKEFQGRVLNGYEVNGYHAPGGTSVILLGQRDADRVAIKIYAKELFEGDDGNQAAAELARIGRQLSAGQHRHPNIVQTRVADRCQISGYHYLIMDFVPDPTLEELGRDIPREKIRCIIQQVAGAALFLHETLQFVHRDIKPANIAMRRADYHATILDLGLIRPISGKTATDQGGRPFLGTDRYAAPEYLANTISRDPSGWEAVTYYQLGGLLHDLIMGVRLFDSHDDRIVHEAVHGVVPHIDADDVPPDLVQLARDCLLKNPADRLALVKWDRFLKSSDQRSVDAQRDELRELIRRVGQGRPALPPRPDGATEQHLRDKAFSTILSGVEHQLRLLLESDPTLYPRPTIDVTRHSASSFQVLVSMKYAHNPADLSVTVFLNCDIVDARSQLCACRLASCAGSNTTLPSGVHVVEVYRGSFVAGEFGKRLESELLTSVTALLKT